MTSSSLRRCRRELTFARQHICSGETSMFNRKHSHINDQSHGHDDTHNHTHGTIDPVLLTTQRGIWAVKWSLIGLAVTAVFQVASTGRYDPQLWRRGNGHSTVDCLCSGPAEALPALHLRLWPRGRPGGSHRRADHLVQRSCRGLSIR